VVEGGGGVCWFWFFWLAVRPQRALASKSLETFVRSLVYLRRFLRGVVVPLPPPIGPLAVIFHDHPAQLQSPLIVFCGDCFFVFSFFFRGEGGVFLPLEL